MMTIPVFETILFLTIKVTMPLKDIVLESASAISPVFKLYLINEFQRLKEAENNPARLV